MPPVSDRLDREWESRGYYSNTNSLKLLNIDNLPTKRLVNQTTIARELRNTLRLIAIEARSIASVAFIQ
jgi:hypothetical protein